MQSRKTRKKKEEEDEKKKNNARQKVSEGRGVEVKISERGE
jgi:hypothetical protein